jgi:hypothetical protein
MHRRSALAQLDQTAERASEVGDFEYAHYARFLKAAFGALAGEPIQEAEHQLQDLVNHVRRVGHWYPEPSLFLQAYRSLLQDRFASGLIEEDLKQSEAQLALHEESAEPYVRTAWVMVLSLHGRWEEAFAQSEKLGDRLFRVVPYIHVADHTFYRGLAAAGLATAAHGRERWRYVRALRQALIRLERWSRGGPDFKHMLLILQGENARLRGDLRRALLRYEEARKKADEQEFTHHSALAEERRGRLLLAKGRLAEAAAALARASWSYREWGWEARAAALETERNGLLQGRLALLRTAGHRSGPDRQ